MIYLDTSYIAKCYLNEPGTAEILAWLEGQSGLCCCYHGRLELHAAIHRHVREGRLSASDAQHVFDQFLADDASGVWVWYNVTPSLVREACDRIRSIPAAVFLRSADALHLTCAANAGFKIIYSHDRHLLSAADHFGIDGRDILSP